MASEVSNAMHAYGRNLAKKLLLDKAIDNVLAALKSDDPEKTSQDKLDDAVYAWTNGQKKIQAVDF
jgi:hypothetical protein